MANTKITTNVIADGAITSAKLDSSSLSIPSTATATTQSAGDNSTKVATTAYVETAVANLVSAAPAALDTLDELAAALGDDANFATTVTDSLALKAPLASPDFTGDVTFDTSTLVVDSTNNRVGIGTASPDHPLHVSSASGAAQAFFNTTSGNTNFQIKITEDDGTVLISKDNTAARNLSFQMGSDEAMRITSSGNVLVGKTSADNGATVGIEMTATDKLYVTDSASSPLIANRLASDGNVIVIQKDGTSVGTLAARIGDLVIGNNDVGLRFSDGGDSILPAQSGSTGDRDNAIDLGASGARFKDAYLGGNLAIGTTSPQGTLHVKNTSDSATLTSVSDSIVLSHQSGTYTDGNYYGVLGFSKANSNGATLGAAIAPVMDGTGAGTDLTFSTALAAGSCFEKMRITDSGNVGIGDTSPDKKLHITDTSGNHLRLAYNDSYYWDIGRQAADGRLSFTNVGGSEYLTLKTDGKVGIGTTSPSAQLELEKTNSTAIASGTAPHGIALSYGTADGNNAGLWFSPAFGDDQGIAGISSQRVTGYQTDLRFYTNNTNSARSFSERLIIDQLGRHAMGNTPSISTNYILSIDSDASGQAAGIHFTHGTKNLYLGYNSTTATDNAEMWNAANGYLRFGTNNAERMRIHDDGKISINETADAGLPAQLQVNSGGRVINAAVSNTGFASNNTSLRVERSATSAYQFLLCRSGARYDSSTGDTEFNLRGDGNGYADGSWNGGGADYAEYFEWQDGNPDNEDRVGYAVSLVGNKIKIAEAGEEIIGVISGNPSVVGDTAWNDWQDKYLKDDFGRYLWEEYADEEGNTTDDNGDLLKRRVLNPDYDDSLEYQPRENRQEWDVVGLMGKLRVRVGQQTGSNWIKLQDISDTVEEWLVK